MKNQYRTRKVVLDHGNIGESRHDSKSSNEGGPVRFHPGRVILRSQAQQEGAPRGSDMNIIPEDQPQEAQYRTVVEPSFESERLNSDNLDARDRRLILRYPMGDGKFSLEHEMERFNQWLGDMHFKVVSNSFHFFLKGELTYEEAKVHCCENLLANLLIFLEGIANPEGDTQRSRVRKQLNILEMSDIMKHINETLRKNLNYMQIKYPMTKESKPNKALQSLIFKINNLGSDEFDIIAKSPVEFKLKEDGVYTPEIMRFLNHLIIRQGQPSGMHSKVSKKELNFFEYFYETIQKIFTSVFKPEEEDAKRDDTKKISPRKQEKKDDPAFLFAQMLNNHEIEEDVDDVKTKEQKEYKEKVQKYTNYLIGQKISTNLEVYSEKDIKNERFDVKNASILRILTKWAIELEKKIVDADENILKRPFRYKKHTKGQYSKLSANQKNDLYQQARKSNEEIKAFNDELKESYNQIESMLSFHLKQDTTLLNIPRNEYRVGYFCSKIQASASSTLLSYLNKMIHTLLSMPQEVKKAHSLDEEYVQNMDINLVTFKISDLFRCKIKSRESEIVRIFNQIKQISEKGDPFKIVRIKNRLAMGTKDIMVNVLFKDEFLCEIQLAIEDYQDAKQKVYDTFSHYLYELYRSRLGPIMESACTWAQFDQRVKIFRNINLDKSSSNRKVPHNCGNSYIHDNKYPFVCSTCQRFFATQQGLVKHKRCDLCKAYYECSQCLYRRMDVRQIGKLVGLQEKVGIFEKDFALWAMDPSSKTVNFPRFGLITSRQVKKPSLSFFQMVVFKNDTYILELKEWDENKADDDQYETIVIERVVDNKLKEWKRISSQYIIYEWLQTRLTSKKITPDSVKQTKLLEEKKRQEEKEAQDAQRQKRKDDLEKKRKEDQEKWNKFIGADKEKDKKKDKEEGDEEEGEKGQKGQKGKKKGKKKKGRKYSQSSLGDEEEEEKVNKKQNKKEQQKEKQQMVYHQELYKRSERLEMRVAEKQVNNVLHILVLNVFEKESTLRNKLKKMNNKNILPSLTAKKMEVIFLEDVFIENELNDTNQLTEAQVQEVKETLERMGEVYLDYNYIRNLEFLKRMPNLKVAHLAHNAIEDIKCIEELPNLQQIVLEDNQIEDLAGLYNARQLTELNLNRNKLEDLTFFSQSPIPGDFAKLKHLYLSDNSILSMVGIEKLTSLVKLDLSYNSISQIEPHSDLTELRQLDLSHNSISKLAGIDSYHNLRRLYMTHNRVYSMSSQLASLTFLEVLDFGSNRIHKIDHVNQGPIKDSLRILKLASNKIGKMAGVDQMLNLTKLDLCENEIRHIDTTLKLPKLQKLDLSHNSIENLEVDGIDRYMPKLKVVKLNANYLHETNEAREMESSVLSRFGALKLNYKTTSFEQD